MEILAPAGNVDCAKTAIHSGANAIYLGIQSFSARQSASNFDDEGLRDIILEAHLLGVKVYVAMNTAIKEVEVDDFMRSLLRVWSLGADAIIMQDALLGKAIHEQYPDIILHLSTQAGVCSLNGAKFAKECGFSRVILARETPLEEIKKIASFIETEVFVQGALCTCYSGQCYFSSFAGGHSGNRGRCKQPCRKLYTYDREEGAERNYALSLSDLSVGEEIEKYIQAGVVSFKIEGRMRRAEYVAAAIHYYKTLLSHSDCTEKLSDLKRTYNRGNYTKGLAFGQDKRLLSTNVQGHLGEKVGVVKVVNGKYFVESAFVPQNGDAFKILRAGQEVGGATFVKNEKRAFVIQSKSRLKNGDNVFITTDTATNTRLLQAKTTRRVHVSLHFVEGEVPVAEMDGVIAKGDTPLQTAQNRPLQVEELKSCFEKTDGLPIQVLFENVDVQGQIFLPKSTLNAFRRNCYQTFCSALNSNQEYTYTPLKRPLLKGTNGKVAVIASDFSNVQTDVAVYKAYDMNAPLPSSFTQEKFEKYVYYPAFCTSVDEDALLKHVKDNAIDGVYVENYAGLIFAKENALHAFVGTGFNLFNKVAIDKLLQMPFVSYYAISKELNEAEQRDLVSEKAFVLQAGDIKLMDLCYCPFGKTCGRCSKKNEYRLTDEHNRVFPVRRYQSGDGSCRFEVYNCAFLVGAGVKGAGAIVEMSIEKNENVLSCLKDVEKQKEIYKNYTFGHAKRGVL